MSEPNRPTTRQQTLGQTAAGWARRTCVIVGVFCIAIGVQGPSRWYGFVAGTGIVLMFWGLRR